MNLRNEVPDLFGEVEVLGYPLVLVGLYSIATA
jgi:hypothetical protein